MAKQALSRRMIERAVELADQDFLAMTREDYEGGWAQYIKAKERDYEFKQVRVQNAYNNRIHDLINGHARIYITTKNGLVLVKHPKEKAYIVVKP